MKDPWEARIERASRLALTHESTRELLEFYGKLLRAQRDIYESLRGLEGWLPSGLLEQDLQVIRVLIPDLLRTVEAHGSPALGGVAEALLVAEETEWDEMLLSYWREPSDIQFFPKAFLQPYAAWLAESGGSPLDRQPARAENLCPFCGGRPQVSFLQTAEATADGGGRGLVCSTCLGTWSFKRVVCANCNEQNPRKLGYFQSPEFGHIRVDGCDTCNHYIKSIDLTRLGLAVPIVDEVAGAPLDLWAQEHGYKKIELNLVGV
jgi:formate dehydrogenase accessory protein FdhE